jgi:hypothetical protein
MWCHRGRRGCLDHGVGTSACRAAAPGTAPGRSDRAGVDTDLEEDLGVAGDDDEVLGSWTVPFTRRHVRAAVVLSALFGLTATTSSNPGVRDAGAVVLGVAASIAMFEMIRACTSVPAAVPVAA